PDGIYTAPTDEALKRDIELSMALGFNGARLHEKIFEARFLYHCDKAGYLVWGEHANWGLNITVPEGLVAFLPEWIEAVERDFNHPAIIGWCPFNETWDFDGRRRDARILAAVYHATKAIDPTRPVIDTSGNFHVVTDIYDQHDYNQDPAAFRADYIGYDGSKESFALRHADKQVYLPDLPFFLSEFGGIKWVPEAEREAANKDAWGYGNAPQTEEEFLSRYEGLVAALLEAPNIMGFCYTQLYDVEQETNGLYTYARKKKFDDYSRIIAANTKKAAIED
ncbi:MAG: beta-galactosidase, partial [Clostridia bacterium]|nr:beta-galactosidase [Clostridia bacterium]